MQAVQFIGGPVDGESLCDSIAQNKPSHLMIACAIGDNFDQVCSEEVYLRIDRQKRHYFRCADGKYRHKPFRNHTYARQENGSYRYVGIDAEITFDPAAPEEWPVAEPVLKGE